MRTTSPACAERRFYARRLAALASAIAFLVVAALFPLTGPRTVTAAEGEAATWQYDTVLADAKPYTLAQLGATQGVSLRDGKLYLYGDLVLAQPRVGVIREYSLELEPTGRCVMLTRGGKTLIQHPTGLTWDDHWGTFLGDSVGAKATIYQLDWERAWADGHLDHAVQATIVDDAATRGCRPEFVSLAGKRFLATADYGDVDAEIRLLDVEALLAAQRTKAEGVIRHRIRCGPFNQNLRWNADDGTLTCIQNVRTGRGWRLDVLDLSKAVAAGNADAAGVRLSRQVFPAHSELEGYQPLDGGRSLFVVAAARHNAWIGTPTATEPAEAPAGKSSPTR